MQDGVGNPDVASSPTLLLLAAPAELGSGILHRVPHIGSDSEVPDEKHKQPELSSYPHIYVVSLFPGISNKIGVGVGRSSNWQHEGISLCTPEWPDIH